MRMSLYVVQLHLPLLDVNSNPSPICRQSITLANRPTPTITAQIGGLMTNFLSNSHNHRFSFFQPLTLTLMAFSGVAHAHGHYLSLQHAGLQHAAVFQPQQEVTFGQSYKHFTIVNYGSRVVICAILQSVQLLHHKVRRPCATFEPTLPEKFQLDGVKVLFFDPNSQPYGFQRVTNAHGASLSQQDAVFQPQQEVTRPCARFEPTLPEKFQLDGVKVLFSPHKNNVLLFLLILFFNQCDTKKIAKCLSKLPKNDFTRKMNDVDTFTKIV